MRGGWSTLALVAAALGLGAYIYFVESKRPDTEAKEKVFAVETDAGPCAPRGPDELDLRHAGDVLEAPLDLAVGQLGQLPRRQR